MAWTELESKTLTSASLDLDLGATTAMSKNKSTFYMTHILNDGTGNNNDSAPALTFDNVSTQSYSNRVNEGGTSETTFVNQNMEYLSLNTLKDDFFSIVYIFSVEGEEQMMLSYTCDNNNSPSSSAPIRGESMNKYVGTTQFTRLDNYNNRGSTNGYEYDVGSNATALGSDGVEELIVQDGAVYYDKQLNKEYILSNNTWTEL